MLATKDIDYQVSPSFQILRRDAWYPDELKRKIREWSPQSQLGKIIRETFKYLPAELAAEVLERITSVVVLESTLAVAIIRHPDSIFRHGGPLREEKGITSRRIVTTTGVGFWIDDWQGSVEMETMKYHAIGTSAAAEAVGTHITGEATTQYNPDNIRATGTLAEAAANILSTVGTNVVDQAITVEEHELYSDADVGQGVGWDRSLTGTQTLSASDGIETTYQMTATAGG